MIAEGNIEVYYSILLDNLPFDTYFSISGHAFVSLNVPPTNIHSTICRILEEAALSIKEKIVVMMMLRARIAKENFSKIVEFLALNCIRKIKIIGREQYVGI